LIKIKLGWHRFCRMLDAEREGTGMLLWQIVMGAVFTRYVSWLLWDHLDDGRFCWRSWKLGRSCWTSANDPIVFWFCVVALSLLLAGMLIPLTYQSCVVLRRMLT
jgi:hypothetical protein